MFTGILIGLLALGTVVGTVAWSRSKGVKIGTLTWVVLALVLVYTLGVIATAGAFLTEGEAQAVGTFLMIFLVPTVIGLLILRLLLVADRKKAAVAPASGVAKSQ